MIAFILAVKRPQPSCRRLLVSYRPLANALICYIKLLYVDEIDRRLPSFQDVPSNRIDRRERSRVAGIDGSENSVAAVRAVELRILLQVDEPVRVARVRHVPVPEGRRAADVREFRTSMGFVYWDGLHRVLHRRPVGALQPALNNKVAPVEAAAVEQRCELAEMPARKSTSMLGAWP